MFCWHNCAESSFRCFGASSWRSRSVLEKSASVLARDSALMVAVFTCVSSASAFLKSVLDGAVEHSLGLCGLLALLLVEAPRSLLVVHALG